MTQPLPPIYFYIPPSYFPQTLPKSADEPWQGFAMGIHAWTLQTYLRLQADGFSCQLVQEFPQRGIVILHRNALRACPNLKPGRDILLVCLKAELPPYPFAQLHVVQNPNETRTFPGSYFLPHWTQPGLIGRNSERGDRFESVAFFGHEVNLAPELKHPSWQEQLAALGLRWQPLINRNRWDKSEAINPQWHDYSVVDVVVAVRSFNHQQLQRHRHYRSKPATKLYNAWLAGVPAILGGESAYQAERQSPLDYLEVSSPDELLAALKHLRDNPSLREAMVRQGQARAREIHPTATTAQWRKFLTEIATPTYYRWRDRSQWSRQFSLGQSYLAFAANRVQDKLHAVRFR
jgi:hypothetical protein